MSLPPHHHITGVTAETGDAMAATTKAAEETEYSPRLQKRTLKGHQKPVLCLAHSSERLAYYSDEGNEHTHHPSLLLSGSEDGTARLWDLRTRKTSLCMVLPNNDDDVSDGNEVTSVAFHPSIVEEEQRKDGASGDGCKSLLPIQHYDCTVYATTANKVYGYDLRYHSANTSMSPILKTPHFDLSTSMDCTDEINQLSFSFPKKHSRSSNSGGKYYMSAADDSGEVHMIECMHHRYNEKEHESNDATTKKKKMKHTIICHAEPETMGITSSALFQPRTNNDTYIASGGTDCTIKLWDVSKPKRPTSTISIKPTESENTTQLCNPPYVHSLSWSSSGRLLSAGIGDGSCVILRAEGRRLVEIGRLGYDEGGHTSAVAAVRFANFGICDQMNDQTIPPKVRKSGEAEDRLMISAGNDGNIIFWDLGENMVGSGPLDPVSYLNTCLSPPSDSEGEDVKDATNAMESLEVSSNQNDIPDPSPPKVVFKIAHGHKPNWITCSRASDTALPTSLFVADTTNNISVYTLPL